MLRTALTYLELLGVRRQGTPFNAAYELRSLLELPEIAARFEGERAQFVTSLFAAAKKGRIWYAGGVGWLRRVFAPSGRLTPSYLEGEKSFSVEPEWSHRPGRASARPGFTLAAISATSHGGGGDVQGRAAPSGASLPWTSSQHPVAPGGGHATGDPQRLGRPFRAQRMFPLAPEAGPPCLPCPAHGSPWRSSRRRDAPRDRLSRCR